MSLECALRDAVHLLSSQEVRFALVGGLAVSVRTEPRFTRDIDLAVSVAGDQEAETLVRGLTAGDYRVLAQIEQQATGRLATVRLAGRAENRVEPVLDLLFASSGIEPEIVEAAESLQVFEDLFVRVATIPHLIALKVLSREDDQRPQDRGDLVTLLRVARPADIEKARAALVLIAARGYARERDLQASLGDLLRH